MSFLARHSLVDLVGTELRIVPWDFGYWSKMAIFRKVVSCFGVLSVHCQRCGVTCAKAKFQYGDKLNSMCKLQHFHSYAFCRLCILWPIGPPCKFFSFAWLLIFPAALVIRLLTLLHLLVFRLFWSYDRLFIRHFDSIVHTTGHSASDSSNASRLLAWGW